MSLCKEWTILSMCRMLHILCKRLMCPYSVSLCEGKKRRREGMVVLCQCTDVRTYVRKYIHTHVRQEKPGRQVWVCCSCVSEGLSLVRSCVGGTYLRRGNSREDACVQSDRLNR